MTTQVITSKDLAKQHLQLARVDRSRLKLQGKIQEKRDLLDLGKTILQDPLIVGLAAMIANEAAYRSGLYEPGKGEQPESLLGGPVWITIGKTLPAAQQKRNLINGMIIGVTTARALAPAMPLVGKGIDGALDLGKLAAAAV